MHRKTAKRPRNQAVQTFISLSDSLNPNIIIMHSTNLTDIPIVGNTESLWQSNDPSNTLAAQAHMLVHVPMPHAHKHRELNGNQD